MGKLILFETLRPLMSNDIITNIGDDTALRIPVHMLQ